MVWEDEPEIIFILLILLTQLFGSQMNICYESQNLMVSWPFFKRQ